MDLLLDLQKVQVNYLDEKILSIDDLKIYHSNRIGIVAPNGSGKTTLLKVFNGDVSPETGTIKRYGSIHLMEQQSEPRFSISIDEKQQSILNIPTEHTSLSGGEKTKLKFLEAVNQYPDLLLLDEPSAHLDEQGVQFIIDHLSYYYGALVLVSHDRYLLNQLVEEIWEVRDGQIVKYSGNFDEYKERKELEYEQTQNLYIQMEKEKARLNRALQEKKHLASTVTNRKDVREFRSKSSNMTKSKGTAEKNLQKAAKNLEKRIEKMTDYSLPKTKKPVCFDAGKIKEMHTPYPIMTDYIDIKQEETLLVKDVSLQIKLGEKVSIIGKNGSGKSTLLKSIVSISEGVTISKKARIGYFDQETHSLFQNITDITVLDYCKGRSDYTETYLRDMLSRIYFTGNNIHKKLSQLSGGEITRLSLLLLFVQNYNILLLDEPTNFLDIETIEVVEEFILNYPGTVVCVSHDSYFVKRISDVIYSIEDNKLVQVPYNNQNVK